MTNNPTKQIKLKAIIVCKTCGRIASDPDDKFGSVHCMDHPNGDLEVVFRKPDEDLGAFQLWLFEKMED